MPDDGKPHRRTQALFREFRGFLLRGNLVDLAVGVVVGVAFGALVNSLVKGLITPLIAAIFGKSDFSQLSFTINGSKFAYGDVINALITFISAAVAVFFFVVKPYNVLIARWKVESPSDDTMRLCPECMSPIPKAARRCSHCTTEVGVAA